MIKWLDFRTIEKSLLFSASGIRRTKIMEPGCLRNGNSLYLIVWPLRLYCPLEA